MAILDELKIKNKLSVITTQRLLVYYRNEVSESSCYNIATHTDLKPTDLTDTYGLDLIIKDNEFFIYIPKGAKCTLKRTVPNVDCTVFYKYIECDLLFEDEPIDDYFEIIE